MSEVTRILSAIEQGDPTAAEQLLPLVYEELRKIAAQRLAQEAPDQTLQATAFADGPRNAGIAVADDDHVVATDLAGLDAAHGNTRVAVGAEQ
jgi:hypothetical protein